MSDRTLLPPHVGVGGIGPEDPQPIATEPPRRTVLSDEDRRLRRLQAAEEFCQSVPPGFDRLG
jgi:hypothetical protein